MKEQLFEIKEEVREKASEIVAEVKKKWKKALNKVSEFLGIKEKLQKFRNNVQKSITDVEQSIEKIDALGTGMREAVQKAANTIRAFTDKPEKEYGEKKFSKTELIKKPLQAKRKLLCSILGYTDAAIEKVEKLSADVKQYQMGCRRQRDDDRHDQCQRRHDRRLFHRSGTHWIYSHGKWFRWRTGHLQRFVPRGKHHFLRSVGGQHFSRLLGRDLCGGAHRQQQGKFIYEQLRVVYRCEERSPKLWGVVQCPVNIEKMGAGEV